MRLIKQGFEIIEQPSGLEGMYKMIEMAGRTCYKSEDKITETSAKEFVDRMIKSGHGAMSEHGTVYLDMPNSAGNYDLVPFFASNPYSELIVVPLEDRVHNYVTTNFRVIIENFAEEYIPDILQYWCEPTEYHKKRYTVKWTIDRVTGESFLRHRVFSFARESTRYCNYSKDKFGNELTFIIPNWLDLTSSDDEIHIDGNEDEYCYPEDVYTLSFLYTLKYAERAYLDLLEQWEKKVPDKRFKSGFKNNPWKPQQARQVLPFSVSSPLVMTGFASDWLHFFDLRCDNHAHPQAREIATALKEEFIKRKYIKE